MANQRDHYDDYLLKKALPQKLFEVSYRIYWAMNLLVPERLGLKEV